MIEYCPGGLGRVPKVRARLLKPQARKLPPKHARQAINKARRRAMRPVANVMLNGVDQDAALGFSLKPPKKIRKAVAKAVKQVKHVATLKNALKVAAVGGALLAAPVVLPALAHGVVAGGGMLLKGAKGAAGGLAKAATGLFRGGSKNGPGPTQEVFEKVIPDLVQPDAGPAVSSAPAAPAPIAPGPTEAAAAPAFASSSYGGDYGGGGGGGGVSMPSAAVAPAGDSAGASESPQAAGISGASLPMLALAAAGLFMLSKSSGPRRRRR